jgi:hypothetical protein
MSDIGARQSASRYASSFLRIAAVGGYSPAPHASSALETLAGVMNKPHFCVCLERGTRIVAANWARYILELDNPAAPSWLAHQDVADLLAQRDRRFTTDSMRQMMTALRSGIALAHGAVGHDPSPRILEDPETPPLTFP